MTNEVWDYLKGGDLIYHKDEGVLHRVISKTGCDNSNSYQEVLMLQFEYGTKYTSTDISISDVDNWEMNISTDMLKVTIESLSKYTEILSSHFIKMSTDSSVQDLYKILSDCREAQSKMPYYYKVDSMIVTALCN